MVKQHRANLSYLAGFFDGEGCISLAKSGRRYALIVQVTQCNRWILELFRMHFGGGIHQCERNGNPFYIWSITASKAMAFLETIEPYLILKKAEANLATTYQKRKNIHAVPLSNGQRILEDADYILMRKLKEKVKRGRN